MSRGDTPGEEPWWHVYTAEWCGCILTVSPPPPPHHNRFTALFPGPPRSAGARRELLDFMVQRKINRGRHTDHPAGRHSIQTDQCQPPPSPHFYRPDALPAAQPTVSKHWRQLLTVSRITYLPGWFSIAFPMVFVFPHFTGFPLTLLSLASSQLLMQTPRVQLVRCYQVTRI